MPRALPSLLAVSAALWALPAGAVTRSFATTFESKVLAPGQSELGPWTTFRVGRSRYYSGLDGQLSFEHGVTRGLSLSFVWLLRTVAEDVVTDALTRQVTRVTSSELTGAAAEAKYQLTDPSADAVGSALLFRASLGPNQSALGARAIVDRSLGRWLLAANVAALCDLSPRRGAEGSELSPAFVLEPSVAAAYVLPRGVSFGLELRAPIGLAGDEKSNTLFGGPVARVSGERVWATLGVQPQLVAFSGRTEGSRLDLSRHERLEVRFLAGLLL
jgi:hypothetical protein